MWIDTFQLLVTNLWYGNVLERGSGLRCITRRYYAVVYGALSQACRLFVWSLVSNALKITGHPSDGLMQFCGD